MVATYDDERGFVKPCNTFGSLSTSTAQPNPRSSYSGLRICWSARVVLAPEPEPEPVPVPATWPLAFPTNASTAAASFAWRRREPACGSRDPNSAWAARQNSPAIWLPHCPIDTCTAIDPNCLSRHSPGQDTTISCHWRRIEDRLAPQRGEETTIIHTHRFEVKFPASMRPRRELSTQPHAATKPSHQPHVTAPIHSQPAHTPTFPKPSPSLCSTRSRQPKTTPRHHGCRLRLVPCPAT